ncbi:hypothetical protein [Myxosarcina sp. GI1(2024)]
MSEQQWAAIVYGRSYQLDFRFIALPEDFREREITWASKYIFATTRKAKKLSTYPRWSLFKNESHCVVGVTCMVRELISSLNPDLTAIQSKDNRGRPLYIFVGYVTRITNSQCPLILPAYTGDRLRDFANLYRYVGQVWTVEDYHQNSKKPLITNYRTIGFSATKFKSNLTAKALEQLNHEQKYPDRVFLWQNNLQNNLQLWLAAAHCPYPVSLCLNINSKQYFANSPFLNQTLSELESFTIRKRVIAPQSQSLNSKVLPRSLSTTVANKVKNDLEITIHHANHAATLGKELVENFTDWTKAEPVKQDFPDSETKARDNFGFKSKESNLDNSDWF